MNNEELQRISLEIPEYPPNAIIDPVASPDLLYGKPLVEQGVNIGFVLYHDQEQIGGKTVDFRIIYYPDYSGMDAIPGGNGLYLDLYYFEYKIKREKIAEIGYNNIPEKNIYKSHHRLVATEQRRIRIGSRLLKRAETFFQRLADVKGKDILLVMPLAQAHVMKWALDNDYMPAPRDRKAVDDIIADFESEKHSGHYEFANDQKQVLWDGIERENYVFFADDRRERNMSNAIRINFTKTIRPKGRNCH